MKGVGQPLFFSTLTSLLRGGKTVKVGVNGMSMFPFLLTNDVVLVKPAAIDEIKYGQVVVFVSGRQLVVHRVVGLGRKCGTIITRGDGLARMDNPVKREDIVGIVTGVIHSRWALARLAAGRMSPVWAFVSPVTGPVFRAIILLHEYIRRRFRVPVP